MNNSSHLYCRVIEQKNSRSRHWLHDTERLLKISQYEYAMGRKLKLLVEEALSLKTADLISQHDQCNVKFSKRIAEHRDGKDSLETHLSQVNKTNLPIYLTHVLTNVSKARYTHANQTVCEWFANQMRIYVNRTANICAAPFANGSHTVLCKPKFVGFLRKHKENWLH